MAYVPVPKDLTKVKTKVMPVSESSSIIRSTNAELPGSGRHP